MKVKKRSGRKKSIVLLSVISFLIIVCSILTVVPYKFGINNYIPVVNNISLGIDLKGGVYAVMQAERPTDEEGKPVNDDEYKQSFEGTITVLQNRLIGKGFTEATVVKQGADRIRIEIPDVDNPEEVFNIIGKPAVLEFKGPDKNVILTGSKHLQSAYTTYDADGKPAVGITLNDEGSELFSKATSELKGKAISIFVDGKELSSPTVNDVITNGKAIISGMGTIENARNLAVQLQSGALPLKLADLEKGAISPTLGQDALKGGIIAGIIGLALIMIFMCVYYKGLGIVSSIALIIYTVLLLYVIAGAPVFFSLKIIPSVQLTLPGIAGIILSIGMAVDANVIIFERIRDEYRLGKTIEASVKTGFKRATAAILDSNITTVIAGVVLMFLGTGSIKGFASVLLIGIILSVISALFISRVLIRLFLNINSVSSRFYGLKREEEIVPKGVFKKEFKIVENRKKLISASLIIITAGLLVSVIFGLNLGIDFTGGTIINVQIGTDLNQPNEKDSNYGIFVNTITDSINEYSKDSGHAIETGTPQMTGTKSDKGITLRYNFKENLSNEDLAKYNNALQDVIEKNVRAKMNELEILDTNFKYTYDTVGGVVSSELVLSAFWSVALTALLMLIYLAFRFELVMGAASVIALMHDVFVMFAFVAIFRYQINSTFIAAMITIIGYSINATIVIFDRIRENLKRLSLKDASYAEIGNKSIKETLMRSINTSLTTLFTILALYIIGVPSIKEFAFPIIIGILAGGYSSIFLATSIWVMFKNLQDKNKARREKSAAVKAKAVRAN